MRWTGPFESAAVLTVVPVPARATASTRGVLPWAPLIGLLLGGVATGVAVLGTRWISPLAGAVLAVTVLALLTRGLHLDGLADTADGLGPLRDRERALEVMRSGDVGPFGVATLVLTLLLQVACAAALLATDDGWLRAVGRRRGRPAGDGADRPPGGRRRGGFLARSRGRGHRLAELAGRDRARHGRLRRPAPPGSSPRLRTLRGCSSPPRPPCSPPRCCTGARRRGSAGPRGT